MEEALNNWADMYNKVDKERFNLMLENGKLKQTLTEIKEIVEEEVHTRMLFADEKSFCDFNKILQKISECEVEK